MTVIEDLLKTASGREYVPMPEMNPLTENDVLQEAQLLDVRLDALRSTAGLLFDLRGALQLREANTGVLIVRGVGNLTWSSGTRGTGRTAWTVDGSIVTSTDRLFGLELGLWPAPAAELTLAAESAGFFVGEVPGLDRIPDYVEDDELTIHTQLASWQSEFELVSAAFLGPAQRA